MYKIGDKVKVSSDNDNDCYDEFRNKTLIITHVAHDISEHPGYDSGVSPACLYDLKDESGNEIYCSLYDYELEAV